MRNIFQRGQGTTYTVLYREELIEFVRGWRLSFVRLLNDILTQNIGNSRRFELLQDMLSSGNVDRALSCCRTFDMILYVIFNFDILFKFLSNFFSL